MKTPTGPRKGCVVEDRRAWRWIGVGSRAPTGANPGRRHVIAALRYDCSGEIHGGLCPTGRYDGYVHEWRVNPPIYDETEKQIVGPVRWNGAIEDWTGGAAPAPGSPTYRIGRLDFIRLSSGRIVKFEGAGLWRDAAGTALFILGENPATEFAGVPLVDVATMDKVKDNSDLTAVLFVGSECSACRDLKTYLARLGRRFPHAFAFDVDRPGHVEPAIKEGVRTTPAVILYRKGKVVARITRVRDVLEKLEKCEAATLRGLSGTRRGRQGAAT